MKRSLIFGLIFFSLLTRPALCQNFLQSFDGAPAASPTLPLAIGLIAALYVINPVLQYDGDKLSAGVTKEISVGFGYFGEHRAAFEYTYLFRSDVRNSIKVSYKYDILLTKLRPSRFFQTTSAISIGGGYFTNFKDRGVFPELSYGFSIRNHKILVYPHVKLRHIWILNGGKTQITDLAIGITLGIANPFIDMEIKEVK